MRIAAVILALVLIACSSNASSSPSSPDPQTPHPGPQTSPADPLAPGDPDRVADPNHDPEPGPPVAAPVKAGDDIELGVLTMLAPSKIYRVRGTELTIKHTGASMAMASDGEGNDFEYVMADLVLSLGGEDIVVAMAGGQPTEWNGFTVMIDELGFDYSKADVSVLVERVK